MINAIQPVAPGQASPPDPALRTTETTPSQPPAGRPLTVQPEADLRLTIEASQDRPGFVYTLRDRSTGRIIVQLPREDAVKMGDTSDYHAGDLVRTRA